MITGLGVDIEQVQRFQARDPLRVDALAQRILTVDELIEWDTLTGMIDRAIWIAKRWAVKEAAIKALGWNKSTGMNRIGVMHEDKGGPYLTVDGSSSNIKEGLEYHVSISDSDSYVVATVIVEKTHEENHRSW